MNDHPNDPFDELMRRALAEEADRIEPADRLHEIQSRVQTQRKPVSRRSWALTAGAAVVATAAAIGAFAVLTDDTKQAREPEVAGPAATTTATSTMPSAKAPTATPSATPAPDSPKVAPTQAGTPEAVMKIKAVPVYWLGKTVGAENGPGVRLYRTFQNVRGRPALEAVRLLTTSKSGDPDYYSLWTGAAVSSVTRSDGVVTVDFKALPRTQLAPDVADVAVQQLVYTVQGALDDQSEKILVTERGRVGRTLFGQIDTAQPLSRAQAANVQALVWILTPTDGAGVKDPVTVTGVAAAYEAQVNWRATNTRTGEVRENYTNTKEGQKFSPFSFAIPKLGSGEWTIEAYLVSAQDGRITDTDSKTVFVK